MACVDCKDNIINKTPSLIGEPKCGSDCPPETTCDGGYIASTCVYYSGNNLACTGINYGDTLSEVIQQLDSKYGVRVTGDDNCCGSLNDKLIVGEGLVKEIVVQDGCQKLQITATAECQELEWFPLTIESPFVTPANIIYTSGDLSFDMGEGQAPEYAVEYCNGNVKKIWLRGIIEIPVGLTESNFDKFFTLLSSTLTSSADTIPTKTRMIPIGMFLIGSDEAVWSPTILINNFGEMYFSSSYYYYNVIKEGDTPFPSWLSLDGFSYEIN